MKLLVTGGAGFIGSHFCRLFGKAHTITVVDALTYAGRKEAVPDYCEFMRQDIRSRGVIEMLAKMRGFDAIVNFAAESHVDRSIGDPMPFVGSNVHGTVALLEVARALKIPRFLQVSTDEVYGSHPVGVCDEATPLAPRNPYAASKAAADMMVMAYRNTYGLDVVITRGANTYGPGQYPEKLVPLAIAKAKAGEAIPVYGNGQHIRDWLHVEDHAAAVMRVLEHGKSGEVYNVAGGDERTTLQVVTDIIRRVGSGSIEHVSDRPGNDLRYAMTSAKLEALGWRREWHWNHGLDDLTRF